MGAGLLHLHEKRLGPFALGTSTKAFLELTFEMSEPETQRALGVDLLDCAAVGQPGREHPSPTSPWDDSLSCAAQEFDADDAELMRRTSVRFARGLYVFDCATHLELSYFDGRLQQVEARFEVRPDNVQEVAAAVRKGLERSYAPLTEKTDERSPKLLTVTGQRGDVTATLNVDTSDAEKPRVFLWLSYRKLMDAYREQQVARTSEAL